MGVPASTCSNSSRIDVIVDTFMSESIAVLLTEAIEMVRPESSQSKDLRPPPRAWTAANPDGRAEPNTATDLGVSNLPKRSLIRQERTHVWSPSDAKATRTTRAGVEALEGTLPRHRSRCCPRPGSTAGDRGRLGLLVPSGARRLRPPGIPNLFPHYPPPLSQRYGVAIHLIPWTGPRRNTSSETPRGALRGAHSPRGALGGPGMSEAVIPQ